VPGWTDRAGHGRPNRTASIEEGRAVAQAPVSVQLYSVRDAVQEDMPAALERLASIGFSAVELYGFVDRAGEYASALLAAGLTAPSAHAPLLSAEEPDRILEAAATLGVRTIIDPHRPAENWTTKDDIQRTADLLNGLAERAAATELAVGYHNHWWELESRVDDVPALEVLAPLLTDRVVLEVDTFWSEVGGVNAPELLQRLGSRVQLIHVKDGERSRDTSTQQPAGSGEIDVEAVLKAAPNARRVLEFDAYSGDVFEGLAASLAWVEEHDK
jgi:sugar phosphate isomerase/epimerase